MSGSLPIETSGGRIVDVRLSEPGAMPATTDDRGSRPRGFDEAWLSAPLLHRLDLHVGDDLTLENPAGTWTIVGSGRAAEWLDDDVLVLGSIDRDDFRPDALGLVTQVDLPAGATRGRRRRRRAGARRRRRRPPGSSRRIPAPTPTPTSVRSWRGVG